MSSVVWKNLQLFDLAEEEKKEEKKGKKCGGKRELQIGAERRGVKKSKRKAKDEQFQQRSTILGAKGLLLPFLKHSGPKLEEESEEQIVEENLKRLLSLSQISAIDLKCAEKILERTNRRGARRTFEPKKNTNTVFTEADFAKFEKNYVADD
ncbi:uncharacterized protein LOC135948365 [Cloeon dipterum]|uniref:uncharacterized protein LOC135948365 n=1 Tax=Cloeon dipterum TaxID=197152 RepID=UPI00322030C4